MLQLLHETTAPINIKFCMKQWFDFIFSLNKVRDFHKSIIKVIFAIRINSTNAKSANWSEIKNKPL